MKVLDRYSLVLHIFRCNAKTREAKLQISLAEIPLLRYPQKKNKKKSMIQNKINNKCKLESNHVNNNKNKNLFFFLAGRV